MAKVSNVILAGAGLRTFPKPWKGSLLLACGKCQKKLRRDDAGNPAAKLRKALKHQAKASGEKLHLRVIDSPCLKLCPRGAVTVCTVAQLAEGTCSIVRTEAEIAILYGSSMTTTAAVKGTRTAESALSGAASPP